MAKTNQKEKAVSVKSTDRQTKKQWTRKKIIAASIIGAVALALVVFIVLAIALGWGAVRPVKSTEEEARIVGNCDGFSVKYEELRYLTLLHRQSLDSELGKYDSLSHEEKAVYRSELEKRVMADVEKNYVILSLCQSYGVDSDAKEVNAYVQDQLETLVADHFDGSMKNYKEWLAENNLTDSFLRLLYKVDRLEAMLLDHIVENKIGIVYDNNNKQDFVNYIMAGEDWVRTVHVFYPKKSEYVDVSGYADKAAQVAEKLQAIADDHDRAEAMRNEIGKAPFVSGFSITGNGIYFTYGVMGEKYEDASFGLAVYGVSDVVETDDGYYIIMRMPVEREHLNLNTVPDLLTQYQYGVLKGYEDEQKEKIAFEPNEYFKTLNLMEIQ